MATITTEVVTVETNTYFGHKALYVVLWLCMEFCDVFLSINFYNI